MKNEVEVCDGRIDKRGVKQDNQMQGRAGVREVLYALILWVMNR